MRVKEDWIVDLGDLGERECEISADVTEDDSYNNPYRYDIEFLSVTVPCLGNLDVANLISKTQISVFEDRILEIYVEARDEAKRSRGIESYYARKDQIRQNLLGVA